jgi:hypothetical protein
MKAMFKRRLDALEQKSGNPLEQILSGALPPKNHLAMIVSSFNGPVDLRFSTCKRTLCLDGTLLEHIRLQNERGELAYGGDLSTEELHRWTATFPIELSNVGVR